MRRLTSLSTLLIFLLWAPMAVNAASDSLKLVAGQTWVNQSGSTLTITGYGANNSFTGYYINRAAGFGCQNTQYPVSGWVNGFTIGWSVNWANSTQNCGSVTAWAGYYSSASGQILTKWSLATSAPDIIVGGDTFTAQ